MLAISISLALAQNAAPPIVWYPMLADDQRATVDGVLMPGRAIVKKGTIIVFKGSLRDPNNPAVPLEGKVFLRSNSDTRAAVDANGDYSISWDTRSESRPNAKVQLRLALKGAQQDTLIRSCELTLADSDPLSAQISQDAGGVTIKLQQASGLTLDSTKVFVDGVEATTTGTDALHIDPKYLASPNEKANVQIVAQAMKGPEKAGQIAAVGTVDGVQSLSLVSGPVGLTLPNNPFQSFFLFEVQGAMMSESASLVVNGRTVPVDQESSKLAADPRYFSPNEDGFAWVKALTPEGNAAYSKKIALTALKIPSIWTALATKIDEERARLRNAFSYSLGSYGDQGMDSILYEGKVVNLSSARHTMTTIKERPTTQIFVRPAAPNDKKRKILRVAVTTKPVDIGGVTFRTVRVLPAFGNIEQFAGDLKNLFSAGWLLTYKPAKGEPSFSSAMATAFSSPQMRSRMSFLGEYHTGIFEELRTRLTAWATSVEEARSAYAAAINTPGRESVLALVDALNKEEDARLSANIVNGLLQVEVGRPMPEISTIYFIPMARNQGDTDVVTSKRFASFDYVNTPIDIKMYP